MQKIILVDWWQTFVTQEGIDKSLQGMLDSFPNKKIILTNATIAEREKRGAEPMPYEIFSLDHNPDKTDSIYFSKMLEILWLSTDNLIYFERNPISVAAAQSVWITTCYYDIEKRDIAALKEFISSNV